MGGSSGTQFGTFGGTGSVSGLTTLNQFGEIRPGGTLSTDNAGTLTLNGGLTLNAGSLLTYQMGPTGNDSMVIGGVNGLNIAGPMNMTILANGTIVAPGQFPVLDYDTSFVGSIGDIALNTAALAAGFTYSLVNNPTNTSIDFVITGRPRWRCWRLQQQRHCRRRRLCAVAQRRPATERGRYTGHRECSRLRRLEGPLRQRRWFRQRRQRRCCAGTDQLRPHQPVRRRPRRLHPPRPISTQLCHSNSLTSPRLRRGFFALPSRN